jgi:hypothetical protein
MNAYQTAMDPGCKVVGLEYPLSVPELGVIEPDLGLGQDQIWRPRCWSHTAVVSRPRRRLRAGGAQIERTRCFALVVVVDSLRLQRDGPRSACSSLLTAAADTPRRSASTAELLGVPAPKGLSAAGRPYSTPPADSGGRRGRAGLSRHGGRRAGAHDWPVNDVCPAGKSRAGQTQVRERYLGGAWARSNVLWCL